MQDTVSLYVHIPFCRAKCDYCDFFSIPCPSSVSDSYVDALLREAEWQAEFYSDRKGLAGWKTVYVGGGTPSLLSPQQLERLLTGLEGIFPKKKPVEISVEMNPETLTADHVHVMKGAGVTRLSLGIQSMNERVLRSVNRHCSVEDARNALMMLKDEWTGDLCLDLIAGLGDASFFEFESSLNEVLDFEPEHVSLYALTVEDDTPLGKRIASGEKWNEDDTDLQWLRGREMLGSRGYRQYEVSNFSRKGHESRHNMAYWRQEDYIGIGSGAVGSIYDFTGAGGLRYANVRDIKAYTDYWTGVGHDENSIPRETERLSVQTEEFEYLMMGLRTLEGISASEYRKRFSSLEWNGDLEMRLGLRDGLWHGYEERGMAVHGGGRYALTEEGLLFLNAFLTSL